mgnify:CR=1 FL=1
MEHSMINFKKVSELTEEYSDQLSGEWRLLDCIAAGIRSENDAQLMLLVIYETHFEELAQPTVTEISKLLGEWGHPSEQACDRIVELIKKLYWSSTSYLDEDNLHITVLWAILEAFGNSAEVLRVEDQH